MSHKYGELVIRFAKLPLGRRFEIAEEMGCQLQPGGCPEKAAQNTIGHLLDGPHRTRLTKLIAAAE